MLGGLWREGTGVRLVGVGISGFGETRPHQLGLLPEEDSPNTQTARKRDMRALSVATDDIRARFGNDILSYGRDLRFRDRESDTLPSDTSRL